MPKKITTEIFIKKAKQIHGNKYDYSLVKYKLFQKTKSHDKIKTNYCKQNNIKLIRIPYWEKISDYFLLETLSLTKQACTV